MSSNSELRDQAVAALKMTTVGYVNRRWKTPPPGTNWQKALALLDEIADAPTPPPTPPPSGSWTLAPPQPPITTIASPAGVALNVNNVSNQTYHDYAIDNTQDSAILLQGSTSGCVFRRFHITRVDALSPSEPYGVHGVYCKAPNNTFSDVFVDGSGGNQRYQGSGFSVRMRGNTFTNTVVQNMVFAASYFEYDHVAGTAPVSFVNGTWQCSNGDTMVWMDDDAGDGGSSQILQPFHFENIVATGCNYFLKMPAGKYVGPGITIQGCTLNGRLVDAGMVAGVPSSKLTITS